MADLPRSILQLEISLHTERFTLRTHVASPEANRQIDPELFARGKIAERQVDLIVDRPPLVPAWSGYCYLSVDKLVNGPSAGLRV
jgi:hypothetical protein